MPWVKNVEGLVDFLSLVVVYAPDEFPKEDFLDDDEQLTLDLAFAEINAGMEFVKKRIANKAIVQELESQIAASLAAYRRGDDISGAHLLQRFERTLLASM